MGDDPDQVDGFAPGTPVRFADVPGQRHLAGCVAIVSQTSNAWDDGTHPCVFIARYVDGKYVGNWESSTADLEPLPPEEIPLHEDAWRWLCAKFNLRGLRVRARSWP